MKRWKKVFLFVIPYALYGAVAPLAGMKLTDWSFWVFLMLLAANDLKNVNGWLVESIRTDTGD